MSDEMGSRLEMAGMLARLARVRADAGNHAEAVSILSSVVADPLSMQSLMLDVVPVGEFAEELLTQMEEELGPEAFRDAFESGAVRSIEMATKGVLASTQEEAPVKT